MKKPAASMAKPAMKAKAKPAVKAMKAMSVIEHFARSDMADWAAMLLSSKLDAMYTRDVYPVTSQLCQTVCRATLLHIVMGLPGSIGGIRYFTRRGFNHLYFVLRAHVLSHADQLPASVMH